MVSEQLTLMGAADAASDRFELALVFFAVSLFFAGISSLLGSRLARRITSGSAVVLLVPGVIAMVIGQAAT